MPKYSAEPLLGVLHFAYCYLQRLYGFDWVHGMTAVLPPNRFAYGVYRVSGFTSHPLSLGYQLCFLTILAGFFASRTQIARNERRYALVAALSFFLTLLISGSRGPLLVCILSMTVQHWHLISRNKRLVAGLMMVTTIVLVSFTNILQRFQEILTLSHSGDSRFTDWQAYWLAFCQNPIIGLGPVGFKQAILAYYQQIGASVNIGLAHNIFLQIGAELGLVGLVGLLGWMACWLKYAFRSGMKLEKWTWFAMVLVMVLSGMTQNSLRDSEVLYTLVLSTQWLACFGVSSKEESDVNGCRSSESKDIES